MGAVVWKTLSEMWSCNQAEHARVGAFELIAWDASNLYESANMPTYGWELYRGPKLQTQIATGAAGSFEAAKAAAEDCFRQQGASGLTP